MRRLSRKERQRRNEIKSIAGGILIVVALGILGYLIFQGQGPPVPLDSENCPTDQAYAAQIAVLLDPSDVLTSVQIRSVRSRLLTVIENEAPAMTEIRIYMVRRAGRGEMSGVFRVCKPVHPDSVSSLTGNPTFAADRYGKFRGPLETNLEQQLKAPSDSISPILKAIQAAVVSAFQPREASIPRKLFIVSDMIQNSDNMSFYHDPVDFPGFMGDPNYGTLRVDLEGVNVVLFRLARRGEAGGIQGSRFQRFWEDYFRDQGAGQIEWIRVEG